MSIPVVAASTANHAVKRRISGWSALVAIALITGGCDREKGAEPQPKENSAAAKGSGGGDVAPRSGPQRYAIVYDMAGTPLPTELLTGPDGRPATLTSLTGKPTLINLWATWCAPCVEELPTIDALAGSAGTNAHVITLSQDIGDDHAVPAAFLTERGWSHVQSWHDPDNQLGIATGGALPTTLVYDAAGKEVGRVIGPLDWTGTEARALLARAGFPG